MARGLFITGFTIAEVLAIQQRANAWLLEGKTIMNWNDADTSVAKQGDHRPAERRQVKMMFISLSL
jgi:hypothetical protein